MLLSEAPLAKMLDILKAYLEKKTQELCLPHELLALDLVALPGVVVGSGV